MQKTFDQLYQAALEASVRGDIAPLFDGADDSREYDAHQLDCLLNPQKHPPVVRLGPCECGDAGCAGVCFYGAIHKADDGGVEISGQDCVGCGECITNCRTENLVDIKEVVPVFDHINSGSAPVYVLIAPAYIRQFGENVTPGRLRSALKRLGFAGMIEVGLFADILTLKEALEFDRAVVERGDFLLTSCCCPMWIAMIRKVYSTLIPHMPPSVSPMVAAGRAVKKLYEGAVTVFVGPCIAKKAEARQKDIEDAVDYVLTFEEMRDIFTAAAVDPGAMDEDARDHTSRAGRIYARTGGVSEAVRDTVQRMRPERSLPFAAQQGDGVPACKAMLAEIENGEVRANFIEGMGCVGGCVGGPKALIGREDGQSNVDAYGEAANSLTPADNPFVLDLLKRLGFETIEQLTDPGSMLTRDFGKPKAADM